MWPYFSEDGEKVARAVYTIENPFHENLQDLSEFSSELRISDHVFDIQVRAKLGVSIKQPRVDRSRHIETIEPVVDPRSLKTNNRLINSKAPSTTQHAAKHPPTVPLRNPSETTTSKSNPNATNRKPDVNPPRLDPSKRPRLDQPISYSPLQNSHQNTKSSSGWNQPLNSAKSTANLNQTRPNPVGYQPDYRSTVNAFKSPGPMSQQAVGHRFSSFSPTLNPNLVTIQTDLRSPVASAEVPRRPAARLAFGNFQQPQDIRIGSKQSENFQFQTHRMNYNPHLDPRKQQQPPPIRNSACALDPRMQNNYCRAQQKPAQIAANDPRMRANRTETGGVRQAKGPPSSETKDQQQAGDANKRREEFQRREEQIRRKEQALAKKVLELEMETGQKQGQRKSSSDPFAIDRTRAISGDAVDAGPSIQEFKRSQRSFEEEDDRPKVGDYAPMSEILKTFSKEKTPCKATDGRSKNGDCLSLPTDLNSADLANCVAKTGGAPKPASSIGSSRRVTMVRSSQPVADEPSKRIRLDHPYSKTDALATDSDDSFLDSPVSTDTADTAEMEIDPSIESIVSGKIDAEMGRIEEEGGMDLEAKLRRLLDE